MNDGLDDDLRALRAEPTPKAYDLIEARVWNGIAAVRQSRQAAPALYAMRAAAVVGALGLGAASGGAAALAAAGEHQEISAFSIQAHFAPSTLLDDHR